MPGRDLDLLVDAAHRAGEIAAQYWRNAAKAWEKPDGAGPVTEADLAIDSMLRETLCNQRPDYGWLSEETEDDHSRLTAKRVFIVDPIDGTRAFMSGEKSFSHALAVAEEGRVVAAVVFLPMAERLYSAEQGLGAKLNGEKISTSGRSDVMGARVLCARRALAAENWPRGVPEIEHHFRSSLAYRIARVADGSFDATLTFRAAWEWDIAAGALIAAEAGATVSDTAGKEIRFNARSAKAKGLIVAPPALHKNFMDYLEA